MKKLEIRKTGTEGNGENEDMTLGFEMFLANAPSLACVLIAGWMIKNERSGWGWLLFVACILFTTITRTREQKRN